MNKLQKSPNLTAAVAAALSESEQPLELDELVAHVAARRPREAASRSAIQRTLHRLYQAVPLGSGRYGWLSHLLQGVTISHPLSGDEMRRGHLVLDELEHSVFFPQFFQDFKPVDRSIDITLFGAETLQVDAVLERKMWSIRLGQPFLGWLSDLGADRRDDLIITVLDANAAKYEVRTRLREMRDERAIEKRNIRLAILAEELVVEDSNRRDIMPTWDLVARLVGRGFFHEAPPPDDLHNVLHEYSMLRFEDGIGYQLDTEAAGKILGRLPPDLAPNTFQGPSQPGRRYRGYTGAELGDVETIDGESYSDAEDFEASSEYDVEPYDDVEMYDSVCPAYQQYLDSYEQDMDHDVCLEHEEFHLLEAELDMLLQIEAEFGGLLPEQEARRDSLAARLYIDPDSLASMGWDTPDDPNLEDPPFWSN